MAAVFTNGVQGNTGCKVSLKHFACNSQETDRATSNSSLSERALREIYLKGFEIAVKEANPGTIMTAYNCVNGRHCSENKELLHDIVRGELGYKNLFMTDWGSQSYKPNDMHAGAIYYAGGIYYWYSENKEFTDGKSKIWTWGIRVYSSTDLCNWTDLGLLIKPVLDNPESNLFPEQFLDRPHIVKNEQTGKFVCWIKVSGAGPVLSCWRPINSSARTALCGKTIIPSGTASEILI